jgi:hypothetical protein
VHIFIEQMRLGVGRRDIRKQDWWYDECGEGMWRQCETLAQQSLNVETVRDPCPATQEADFLLRQGLSREVMGKWLVNAAVLGRRRRRLLQTIARMLPCATWLHKIRRRPDDLCGRCAKADKRQVETVAHT